MAQVQALVEEGLPLNAAVKQVARANNAPKNALYQQALERLKGPEGEE